MCSSKTASNSCVSRSPPKNNSSTPTASCASAANGTCSLPGAAGPKSSKNSAPKACTSPSRANSLAASIASAASGASSPKWKSTTLWFSPNFLSNQTIRKAAAGRLLCGVQFINQLQILYHGTRTHQK